MSLVRIHTGSRCGRPILAVSDSADLFVGDPVALLGVDGDVQVAAAEGGFVIVRDGRLEAWADTPAPDLPCVSPVGHPATFADITHARDGVTPRELTFKLVAAAYEGNWEARSGSIAEHRAAAEADILGVPYNCPHCAAISAARGALIEH